MRLVQPPSLLAQIARMAVGCSVALLGACGAPPPVAQQGGATAVAATAQPAAPATATAQPTAVAAATEAAPAPTATATEQPTAVPAATIAPTASAAAFVPIIDGTAGQLLGGVQGSRWISAELAAPLVVGGESYRIVTNGALSGTAQGGAPVKGEVPCDWTYRVEVPSGAPQVVDVPVGEETERLAVGGTGELFPRPTQELDVNMAVYRAAVAAELQARGIAAPNVQIARIVRADLDGDGVDEVLINATFYRERAEAGGYITPNARAGDYSLVLLRRLVGGAVVTSAVAESVYPQDKEFTAPLEHRLVGVLDLNGDGALELLVRSVYYEGFSLGVFGASGTAVEQLLSEGCGV